MAGIVPFRLPREAPHEAGKLNLAIDKAIHVLGWRPVLDFARAVKETVAWYRAYEQDPASVQALLCQQIKDYSGDARRMSVAVGGLKKKN